MTESGIDFGSGYVELQETLEKERGRSALLQQRNGELIDAILQHKLNITPGSSEAADRALWAEVLSESARPSSDRTVETNLLTSASREIGISEVELREKITADFEKVLGECENACCWHPVFGWTPEADCPVHDG